MHGLALISMRRPARRPIALLAILCIFGILVSLVQPSFAGGFSKTQPAQAAFAQSHSVNGGKPCKRVVPGAVGTLCSVGALVGLEIDTPAIAEPSHGKTGILPRADKRLAAQWLAAPQYRPPRIDA